MTLGFFVKVMALNEELEDELSCFTSPALDESYLVPHCWFDA